MFLCFGSVQLLRTAHLGQSYPQDNSYSLCILFVVPAAAQVSFSTLSVLCLQEVLSKLASLDADLNEKRAKKAQLEADVHMCTVKLDRAQKLIAGLGGEKSRWTAVAARLGQHFVALTGDMVLAAAQIAYLGRLGCSSI